MIHFEEISNIISKRKIDEKKRDQQCTQTKYATTQSHSLSNKRDQDNVTKETLSYTLAMCWHWKIRQYKIQNMTLRMCNMIAVVLSIYQLQKQKEGLIKD